MNRFILTLLALSLLGIIVPLKESFADSVKVKVIFFDDTDKKPLKQESEIWIEGLGSWWVVKKKFSSPQFIQGSPGQELKLAIYPDGRGEKKLEILHKLKISPSMCSNGCTRDALHVSIDDSKVTLFGKPVEEKSGKMEFDFER